MSRCGVWDNHGYGVQKFPCTARADVWVLSRSEGGLDVTPSCAYHAGRLRKEDLDFVDVVSEQEAMVFEVMEL